MRSDCYWTWGFMFWDLKTVTASAAPSPLYCYSVKAVTGTTQGRAHDSFNKARFTKPGDR